MGKTMHNRIRLGRRAALLNVKRLQTSAYAFGFVGAVACTWIAGMFG